MAERVTIHEILIRPIQTSLNFPFFFKTFSSAFGHLGTVYVRLGRVIWVINLPILRLLSSKADGRNHLI